MTDTPIPAHWSADALSGIAAHTDARLPVFTAADVVRHPIVGRIVEAYEGVET